MLNNGWVKLPSKCTVPLGPLDPKTGFTVSNKLINLLVVSTKTIATVRLETLGEQLTKKRRMDMPKLPKVVLPRQLLLSDTLTFGSGSQKMYPKWQHEIQK